MLSKYLIYIDKARGMYFELILENEIVFNYHYLKKRTNLIICGSQQIIGIFFIRLFHHIVDFMKTMCMSQTQMFLFLFLIWIMLYVNSDLWVLIGRTI